MSNIVTCPNCKTMLRVADDVSSRGACPQCFAPLDNSGAAPVNRAPNVLRDVRRDNTATNRILFVLIVLCAAGIVLTCSGMTQMPWGLGHSTVKMLVVLIGALDLGLIGSIAALSWRISPRAEHRGVALAVRILGLLALIGGFLVAIVIFLCVTCVAALS